MTVSLTSTMTAAQVRERIAEVAAHEAISKTMIANISLECLAHALQHGDITVTTDLIKGLTPANRTAVVMLFKETTAFAYNVKDKAFGKKNKLTIEEQTAKDAALETFMTKYQGNIWAWYEKTKEDKIVSLKFNEKAFVKSLTAYLAEKGLTEFDENFTRLLGNAQNQAKVELAKTGLVNARIEELVALGLDKDVAKMQAEKDYDAGKLTTPVATAA